MAVSRFRIAKDGRHSLEVVYSGITHAARIRLDAQEVLRRTLFVPRTFRFSVGDEAPTRIRLGLSSQGPALGGKRRRPGVCRTSAVEGRRS